MASIIFNSLFLPSLREGTLMSIQNIKKDVIEKLTQAINFYIAYSSGMQIINVAWAHVQKYPCLNKQGTFSGLWLADEP